MDSRTPAARRWDLVDAETVRENARYFAEHGPTGCLRVSEDLYDHALEVGAVAVEDRSADLRHHIELRLKLDRAAERALARR